MIGRWAWIALGAASIVLTMLVGEARPDAWTSDGPRGVPPSKATRSAPTEDGMDWIAWDSAMAEKYRDFQPQHMPNGSVEKELGPGLREDDDEENQDASGYAVWQRARWQNLMRVFPHRDYPKNYSELLLQAMNYQWSPPSERESQGRRRQGSGGDTSRAMVNTWTNLGPTNIAGRVNSLTMKPGSTTEIWAANCSGGIWKSTDAGTTWTPLNDFLATLGISAIVFDPVTPTTIYVGTGDGDNLNTRGIGVLKSTDGGATWNPTGLAGTNTITEMIIHSTNPQILVAGTWTGLYRTTNGGTSWTQLKTGVVRDLCKDPTNSNNMYATFQYSTNNGAWRSTDGGATWALMAGLPTGTSFDYASVAVAPSTPTTVYLSVANTAGQTVGFYRSTNSGVAWTRMSTPNLHCNPEALTICQGWYDNVVAVDPANANLVVSGGVDLFKSTNGGTSWARISYWANTGPAGTYSHADHHALLVTVNGPTTSWWDGNDGGVFRSQNMTAATPTFTELTTNLATDLYYDAATGQASNVILAGAQDNGTQKWVSPATTVTEVKGGDGGAVMVDYNNSNNMYGEYVTGATAYSRNGGGTWTNSYPGNGADGAWVTPMTMSKNNPAIVYTATYRVYKSINNMTSWAAISPTLVSTTTTANCIGTAKSSAELAIAVGLGPNLLETVNGGTNWAHIDLPLPVRNVTSVVYHPTNATFLLATISGYNATAPAGHVFKTTNHGAAWTNVSGNLPDMPALCLLMDPVDPTNTWYVGTDVGVYWTNNGGGTWTRLGTNFPNVQTTALTYYTATNSIRAGTYGRGIWEIANPTSAPAIYVTAANGGETWYLGDAQHVHWSTISNVENIKVELNRTYPGGAWEVLAASVPDNGDFPWTVSGATSATCRIRCSTISGSLTDVSDANFTIAPPLAGDACVNAITVLAGNTTINTTGATDDFVSNGSGEHNNMWYKYTATASGYITVSLCGIAVDSKISIYNGASCVGQFIGSDDDAGPSCATVSASARAPVCNGQTVLISVGAFLSGTTFSGTMNITQTVLTWSSFTPTTTCANVSSGVVGEGNISGATFNLTAGKTYEFRISTDATCGTCAGTALTGNPYMVLYGTTCGTVVAANDDCAGFGPYLTYTAPTTGAYLMEFFENASNSNSTFSFTMGYKDLNIGGVNITLAATTVGGCAPLMSSPTNCASVTYTGGPTCVYDGSAPTVTMPSGTQYTFPGIVPASPTTERWNSLGNPSGTYVFTATVPTTTTLTYYHQFLVTATLGGVNASNPLANTLPGAHSITYTRAGVAITVDGYTGATWSDWVDCGTTLSFATTTSTARATCNTAVFTVSTTLTPTITYYPTSAGQTTWTGDVSTLWSTAGNWTGCAIPTAATDVTIPDMSAAPYPVNRQATLSAGNPACRNLTINAGGMLNGGAGPFTLSVAGNWLNNGAFSAGGGATGTTILFTNAGNVTLGGLSNTTFNWLDKTGTGTITIQKDVYITRVPSFGKMPLGPSVLGQHGFVLNDAGTRHFIHFGP